MRDCLLVIKTEDIDHFLTLPVTFPFINICGTGEPGSTAGPQAPSCRACSLQVI